MATRAYDLVLFGATGFTGALTADYLARNAPADCRWALAGRNRAKLEAVRDQLAGANPACADLDLLVADVTDPGSLRPVVEQTRLLITTVGPYIAYGEPLVAACAEAGTDYVDLTGEPEFVDLMYVRHHDRAKETGARLVHACGFDSIPYDLGVYFTVGQLPADRPIHVDGYVRAGATFSGGTFHSAITAFSHGRSMAAAAKDRRSKEPRPADRRSRARAGRPGRHGEYWTLPMPTIDPQIVARSGRALDHYGPDFTYRQHAALKRLPTAVGTAVGAGATLAMAQIPVTRRLLLSRIDPGDGPSAERRARSWFAIRFIGTAGDERVVTEVSGGDPGYDETAKMLGESALCLAFDDNPPTSGQVTTAVAMGDALLVRLVDAGIQFRTLA